MPFFAGAAEIDITPPPGVLMDGYLARSKGSQGTHDPLYAQVLVLEDGPTRAALVAADVLAVSAAVADPVRQALAELLKTSPEAVMICPSHTHAGPAGLQTWFPIGSAPDVSERVAKRFQQGVIAAAQQAVGSLQAARLVYGTCEVEGVGGDRNTPRPALDARLTALRFETVRGQPIAIVFHYACHPTILGPQMEYSAEFPGVARRRIQSRYPGAVCLYLNGAAGNISTRFYRQSQSFEEMERLGGLVGECALTALDAAQPCETRLSAACAPVDLPFRVFPEVLIRTFEETGHARIDQTRAEGAAIEARLAEALRGRTGQQALCCALRIGPWKLLSVPGEAFNELAAALREHDSFALVVGYANDYLGYFPTQAAIDAQTYEALSSPYDARALTLIQKTLEQLLD